ncbi:MAG: hypothetical protein U0694_22125 [Anaerolineae bacterium]
MSRLPFFILWTASTLVGWAAGLLLWFAVIWLGWEALPRLLRMPYFVLNMWRLGTYLLAMAMLGGGIGFAQWRIAFRRRVFPGALWTLTSALCGAGLLLGIFASSLLSLPVLQTSLDNPNQPEILFRVEPTWLPGTLLIGAAIGLCIGLPQALLLRRYLRGARWWVLSTIAACCAAGVLFVLIIRYFSGEYLALVLGCAVLPLAFGAITGISMQRYLHE